MTARNLAKRLLAAPTCIAFATVLSALLVSPSLRAGLAFDDYFFEVILRRLPLTLPQRGPLDLFRFADGDARTARILMDTGTFAWTADPAARNGFLRPISALTHVLDYAAWPHSHWAMHLQSIAWMAAAVTVAGLLYRRFLGPSWVAGLATVLYAMDDSHGSAVAWIANRNAFVAGTFSFSALWFHDRWRAGAWRPGALLGPTVFGIALLAGESSLGIAGYLFAYAVHLERGSARERALTLAPYALAAGVWRAIYGALGYGVQGSDLYLDPIHRPGAFLAAFPRRYLALLSGEFAFPRPDVSEVCEFVGPWMLPATLALAVMLLALLARAVVPLWKRDRTARFFVTGLALACVPICATAPGGRLLTLVGLGAMGLIAQLITSATAPIERAVARGLVGLHIVAALLLLPLNSMSVAFAAPQDLADDAVPRDGGVRDKTIVLVNPPNDGYGAVLIAERIARGLVAPRSVVPLAGVTSEIEVARTGPRSLRLRPARGFLEHTLDRNWRSLTRPVPVGVPIELSAMTATVADVTPDQRPQTARFDFRVPLEDPSLVWLQWTHGHFVRWSPPREGETVHLAANDVRQAMRDLLDHEPQ